MRVFMYRHQSGYGFERIEKPQDGKEAKFEPATAWVVAHVLGEEHGVGRKVALGRVT